ncbi:MAG: hypothetical protein VBE63_25955 [Lamprobacter sp.]|uniref:hypothetical protein n=1 Tax=Lamprobacter sp. TaxID=3100796 RepID=UPI002B26440A|nr:hypothetical protein [Lamprobacter sp.]MEA3643352.1 hypothetical protein [Lamprobacter sp.]
MATLDALIDAYVASREFDRATLSRLEFWRERFGPCEFAEITADDVDIALVALAERGRLKPRRHGATQPAGQPLAGSTINRYITQLGSLYRYARRLRLLPRAYVPPTKGIEKSPEGPNRRNLPVQTSTTSTDSQGRLREVAQARNPRGDGPDRRTEHASSAALLNTRDRSQIVTLS